MTLANPTNLPPPSIPPGSSSQPLGNPGGSFVLFDVLSGKSCGMLNMQCS